MSSLRLQTKADFQALMHTLLDPLKPFYSAGGARLRLGAAGAIYNRTAIEVEAFSRPLWVLGPFWAGGGRDAALEAIYRNGFAHGADPKAAEYWGTLGDCDQCFVEMAAFACAMIEDPAIVWDPLSEKARQDFAAWLRQINARELPHCNWLFLRVLVNLYAPAEVEKNDHGQFAEKYGKFCYSTRFGFSASRSYAQLAQAAPDSMLAFEIGGQIFVRRHSLRFEVRPDSLFSVWSPFPGITVETEIRPTPTGHIRRHKIHSEIACTAWDCGFAVPRYAPGYTAATEDGAATAANAAVGCTVRGDGKAEVFNTWANTNLYDPNCAISARRYAIHAGDSEWHCEIVEE